MLYTEDGYTFQYERTHTIEAVIKALNEYEELGFEDLPQWLQQELRIGSFDFPVRNPTELEMHDTILDWKEHRMHNNELTLDDIKDKYHV
jgi:hypothetical protein